MAIAKTVKYPRVLSKIDEDGYCMVPGLFTKKSCKLILSNLRVAGDGHLPPFDMGLNDSEDKGNVVHTSKRSPGLKFCYLNTPRVMRFSRSVSSKLGKLTGLNWSGNINAKCLPFFMYDRGVSILPHRGRDIGFGNNDLVAVGMISEPGIDFSSGRFFLNRNADVSDDGKVVTNEEKGTRQYFDIRQGDVLIFNNRIHIHGTEETDAGTRSPTQRVTCSWRLELP